MVSLDDKSAILIYRIGPVYCCSPSLPVENISIPGSLTHPPGTDTAHPGIFKHGRHIVSVSDLRFQFGVNKDNWQHPGRMIITQLKDQHVGFWVDEIIDVIQFPESGWGNLPAQLPRGVFSRTLLLNKHIHLYAEFAKLNNLQGGGYLRQYISKLEQDQKSTLTEKTEALPGKNIETVTSEITTKSSTSKLTIESSTNNKNVDSLHKTFATNQQATTKQHVTNTVIKPGSPVIKKTPERSKSAPVTSVNKNIPANVATRAAAGSKPVASSIATAKKITPTPAATNKPAARIESTESSGLTGFAALILFVIAGGLGAYYYLTPEPEKTPTSATKEIYISTTEQNYSTYNIEPESKTEYIPSNNNVQLIENDNEQPLRKIDNPVSKTERSATIEQDDQGITIILNAPKDTSNDIKDKSADELPSSNPTSMMTMSEETNEDSEKNSNIQPVIIETESATAVNKPAKVEVIHIVVKGDTLWHIARRYVDDPFLYPELARLSNIKNPHRIYPGNRVRIIRYLD